MNTLLAYLYLLRGRIRRSRGNQTGAISAYEAAIAAFGRAIELRPNLARAYEARGILYWREFQKYDDALRDLTRAIALNPRLADAHLNRGFVRVYGRIGAREEMIADFSRYLQLGRNRHLRVEAQLQVQRLQQSA